jgi:hypothetical protein
MHRQSTSLLFGLLLTLSALLTSCGTTQEELWIESDGSGRFESTMDLSAMYPFLMMGLEEQSEEEGNDPFSKTLVEAMKKGYADTTISFGAMMEEESIEKGNNGIQSRIDSLESLPPAETEEEAQERATDIRIGKMMLNMKLRIQVEQSTQSLKFTTINAFQSIDELNQGGSLLSLLMNARPQTGMGNAEEKEFEQMVGKQTQFNLSAGKLQVKRQGSSGETDEMSEEDQGNMEMMRNMLGDSPYRLTIHFPGKAKKVKSPYAERIDDQTIIIEIPQEDLQDDDFELDLGIKFKGLRK